MKRLFKAPLGAALALLALLLPPLCVKAQDSTFWYVNGVPDWWYTQPDMFAFRCVNGQNYTGVFDTTTVSMVLYHGTRRDRAVEFYFKPAATPQQRLDEIATILNSGQLEAVYPVVNRNPLQLHIQHEWYLVDDLILVRFADPQEDSTDIADFMGRYGLTMHHRPPATLPDSGHYTYIFQLPPIDEPEATDYIGFARAIVENEAGFVENVIPNIVNYAWGTDEVFMGAASGSGSVSTGSLNCTSLNDTYSPAAPVPDKYRAWHIDNQGFTTNIATGVNVSAVNDADADICECWDLGYSGQGIKIALLGSGHFIYHHPDLSGAAIPNPNIPNNSQKSWDCRTGNCAAYSHQPGFPSGWGTVPLTQGLTHLASTLVSQHNNATGTAGVVPNASVHTYMTSAHNAAPVGPNGYSSSTAAIVSAIQEIIPLNFDITVTNLVSLLNDINVEKAFENLHDKGRSYVANGDEVVFPGMAIIASSGRWENTGSTTPTQNRYPAAYDQVIGVIGSTPGDLRMLSGDNWGHVADACHGFQYDVAAPGTFYMLNGLSSLNGNPLHINAPQKTEDCAPALVGGIVAMMLEKNNKLSGQQIRDALRNGAQKVSYAYNNGISADFAYGRVSCGQSIQTVSALPPSNPAYGLSSYFSGGNITITFPEILAGERLHVVLYDGLGRKIESRELAVSQKVHTFTPSPLPPAVYYISIDRAGQHLHTSKFISHE